MELNLAQVNIAKMLAPIDSPVMAEFVANLDSINELAEKSAGFTWRLKEDNNNATSIKIYDDDFIIVNMSVWKNLQSLSNFVYRSDHAAIFKRRKEWFERMPEMHMALWYVPAIRFPTAEEARDRLNFLRKYGETPLSFSFKKSFSPEEFFKFNIENEHVRL